jgi:hypothetical protein
LSAFAALPDPLLTAIGLLMVAFIVTLVAWALQLMQSAIDRQEFSLMLAGCMVCSAAVGLATVMVITLTGPGRHVIHGAAPPLPQADAAAAVDAFVLPWDDPLADAARSS